MADFSTLAQIAKPQMMPEAPLGAGGTAGLMYGNQMAQQQNFLASAAAQAQQEAQMQAMKAGEFQLGQPGRLATIDKSNMEATDLRDAYASGGTGRQLSFQQFYNKLGEEDKKAFDLEMPFFQQLAAAKSPQDVQALLSYGKQSGKGKIKGRDITDLPPEAAKRMAEMFVEGALHSPAQMGKERVAAISPTIRTSADKTIAADKNATNLTIAQTRANAAKEVAQLKQTNPNKYSLLLAAANGDPQVAASMLMWEKILPAMQQGQNNADAVRPFLPPEIANKMPKTPTAVVPKPEVKAGPQTKPTAAPKVGDMWGTPQGNKKILGIRKDASGKILQLNVEGLGVVDYK